MVLDLTNVFESPGEELVFSHSIDLSDFEQSGVHPLKKPVTVQGAARNAAGVVTIAYRADYTFDTVCDRCLAAVLMQRGIAPEWVAVRSLNGEDDEEFLVLPNAQLNLDELVYSDLLLDLPSKNLCRETCRGLCPTCGANLNEGLCGCNHKAVDPRLQALADLLEQ